MIRDVKKGDMIIVGEQGMRIIPQERPREGIDIFQFMSSDSSSERPTQHIARKVANDIYDTKESGWENNRSFGTSPCSLRCVRISCKIDSNGICTWTVGWQCSCSS